jgi:hypothetical protein
MGFKPHALLEAVSEDLDGFLHRCPYHGDPDSGKIFAAQYLKQEVLRKFSGDLKQRSDADDAALSKFLAVNATMRDAGFNPDQAYEHHAELFGMVREEIRSFYDSLPSLDAAIIAHHGSLGPGVSVGSRATDFYSKLFGSKLTMTSPTLYDMYKSYVDLFPVWRLAEANRSGMGIDVVTASRLAFVPKNDKVSRTICVEPILNMFFQLGLGKIVEYGLLRTYGLRISGTDGTEQDHNRELARVGSRDGSFSTIDLSSASDSLSNRLMSQLFPRQFLAWTTLFRSPNTELPCGTLLPLNMVSTMGNGFTFPIMTLLFSALVVSVLRHHGIPLRVNGKRTWGVFGDDIIVPTAASHTVLDMLRRLGFTPNSDKTFVSGPFRESCGADFFNGQPVRPVYVKRLDTQQSRYVALNRFVDWAAMTDLSLPETCKLLASSVRWQPVPSYAGYDAGIRLPSSLVSTKRTKGGLFLYKESVPRPLRYEIKESEVGRCSDGIRRVFNPEGFLLCFLRGDVTNGYISVRGSDAMYRTRLAATPNWDAAKCTLSVGNTDWPRWEAAVHRCFAGVMSP